MLGDGPMEVAGAAPLPLSAAATTVPRAFRARHVLAAMRSVHMVLELELLEPEPVRHHRAATRTTTFHRCISLNLRTAKVTSAGAAVLPLSAQMAPGLRLLGHGRCWEAEEAVHLW